MRVESMGVHERLLPKPVEGLAAKPELPTPKAATAVTSNAPKVSIPKRRSPPATTGYVKYPETFSGNRDFSRVLRGGGFEKVPDKMDVDPALIKTLRNAQGFVDNGYHQVVTVCPKGSKINGPRGPREIDPNGLNILQSDESIGPDQAAQKAINAIYVGLGMAGTAVGGLLLGYLAADIWFRNRLVNPYMAYGGFGGYGGY